MFYSRLILFLILCVGLSSCQYIPFFGSKKDDGSVGTQALAYFVPDQKTEFVNKKLVKVKGDMNAIVNILSELMAEKTGSKASVIRNASQESGFGGRRDVMRVVTGEVVVDSVEQFNEHFILGYYLLEDPKYVIKPENMSYNMEAQISIMGQDFYIEFKMNGKTDWTVYEIKKNGDLKKLPDSFKPKIGVGTFKATKEVKTKSRIGNELISYENYNVDVKDQPISKGTTEDVMYNLIMDKFAINDIFAQSFYQ